jgi:hypothetical protein
MHNNFQFKESKLWEDAGVPKAAGNEQRIRTGEWNGPKVRCRI